MTSPYFFLRPILAADRSWVALDWQSANPLSTDGDDLVRSFAESAAAPLADMLSVVMLLNPACLERDEFVNGFDASHVVFVLPGSSLDDANTLDRCTQLRKQGNRFGLQLDSAERLRKVPVALFDYLSLDASFARQDLSAADLNYAGAAGFQKIASNVGTHEMFRWLSGNGIDWSSSQFLAARDPQLGNEPDLTRLKLLKLLNLVRNDGDTREIKGVFREDAYKWVQRNAMARWLEGADFKTNVKLDEDIKKYLTVEEIDHCFDPKPMLKHIDLIMARFGL